MIDVIFTRVPMFKRGIYEKVFLVLRHIVTVLDPDIVSAFKYVVSMRPSLFWRR